MDVLELAGPKHPSPLHTWRAAEEPFGYIRPVQLKAYCASLCGKTIMSKCTVRLA